MSSDPSNLTPREAADELSAQTWADERRERFAAAIFEHFGDLPYVDVLVHRSADAAMAVADAEQHVLSSQIDTLDRCYKDEREWRMEMQRNARGQRHKADNLHAENARLRAELQSLQHDMARIRGNIANGGISDGMVIRSIKGIVGEGPTA